jgi:hypothetical protein
MKNSKISTYLQGENVTYWGIIWSVLSLVCYLSFSVVDSGANRPLWFVLVTTALEQIALLVAGMLCWRNWMSSVIPSGKNVWFWFALGMLAFFLGNFWFTLWELLWGLDPGASAGNPFFVFFYIALILGVRTAIVHKELRLTSRQWSIVMGTATFATIIALWLNLNSARAMPTSNPQPISSPSISTTASTDRVLLSQSKTAPSFDSRLDGRGVKQRRIVPAWVIEIDKFMQPLISYLNLFYILCDVVLLIFAAILFLGFWGGHLGATWRVIARSVLCFYLADTWFAYANSQVKGYESGFIMEIFWIFGIVQFAIAAALEFDNSIRARQVARRRTATN